MSVGRDRPSWSAAWVFCTNLKWEEWLADRLSGKDVSLGIQETEMSV